MGKMRNTQDWKVQLRRLKDLKMAHTFSKILRHNAGHFLTYENRVHAHTGIKASKCLIVASYRNSQNLPGEPNRITLHNLGSEGNRFLLRQKSNVYRQRDDTTSDVAIALFPIEQIISYCSDNLNREIKVLLSKKLEERKCPKFN